MAGRDREEGKGREGNQAKGQGRKRRNTHTSWEERERKGLRQICLG